jgi:hypothetical protein
MLWALDDARTDALAELRAVLLNEHEGRVRDGPCDRRDDQGFSLANAEIIKTCRQKRS